MSKPAYGVQEDAIQKSAVNAKWASVLVMNRTRPCGEPANPGGWWLGRRFSRCDPLGAVPCAWQWSEQQELLR